MKALPKYLAFVALALLFQACSFNLETINGLPDSNRAREFSDEIATLIIKEDKDALYGMMSGYFRKTYPLEVMDDTFQRMSGHFGRLVDFEFKTDEVLNWQYPDGSKTLARKYWYRAKTTNAEMGKYYLQVTVMEENNGLACLAFSLLDFPDGPPDALK